MDLSLIYRTRDINQITTAVTEAVQKVLDSQAPVRSHPNKKNYCPFFDEEISALVNTNHPVQLFFSDM